MSENAQASSSKHKSKSHHSSEKNSSKHSDSKSKSKHSKGEKQRRHSHSHSHKHHNHANGENGHEDGHKEKSKTGPFEMRETRLRLSIPPKFGGDVLAGVRETLDGMVMRYVGQLDGVLLAHWGHDFDDSTVGIIGDCPYGICEVDFQCIVWAPKLDQKLVGTHSLSSPSHISLLCSKTFNVSIPLQHIPQDIYEFEHTASDALDDEDSDSEDESVDGGVHEVGRWKAKKNGKVLGEGGKPIKFTVIGMQVTNQMLSLTGSLLSDPTNPPPEPTTTIKSPRSSPSVSPSRSPTPQLAQPTPKRSQTNLKPKPTPAVPDKPAPHPAPDAPEIDERYLNPRQLKQLRKEQERAKKEARKARKEAAAGEEVLDVVEDVGGADMVGKSGRTEIEIPGVKGSGKRKNEGGHEGGKKRRAE